MIRVQVPGRTFTPVTKPIEFSFDSPTWSLGKSMAAHIAMGRIGEVYNKELKEVFLGRTGVHEGVQAAQDAANAAIDQ